ncbi:MAG: hypothetical protein RLZ98_276 [Pseudomonadota bacterium]|jgi:catechol 2,3-dioxygenase
MIAPRVTGVRSVDLGVADLGSSVDFYGACWGLEKVSARDGTVYLRATGPEHHALGLHQADRIGLLAANFAAADKSAVDALHAKAKAAGIEVLASPRDLPVEAGGGYGFDCRMPEGTRICVSADVAAHDDEIEDRTRPSKFSHVVFRTEKCDQTEAFFADLLGFAVTDRTNNIHFLRCASDHHSVALAKLAGPGLHHMAFELPDLDSLMRASGRMSMKGYPVEHGVGRHAGPGDNVFSFFVEPNGFALEYTTEMEQVDDNYPRRSKEYWSSRPVRPCSWGMAMKATDKVTRAKAGTITAELNGDCSEAISKSMAN